VSVWLFLKLLEVEELVFWVLPQTEEDDDHLYFSFYLGRIGLIQWGKPI
jgi:hypothetical protein